MHINVHTAFFGLYSNLTAKNAAIQTETARSGVESVLLPGFRSKLVECRSSVCLSMQSDMLSVLIFPEVVSHFVRTVTGRGRWD
jgi:hypothetical protein